MNKTITSVNLEGNDIGSEGAKAIIEAFKVNTILKELKLNSKLNSDLLN